MMERRCRLEPVGFGCRFHERKQRHKQLITSTAIPDRKGELKIEALGEHVGDFERFACLRDELSPK